MRKTLVVLILSFFITSWGFHAHKIINRTAIFTLPPEMFGFYKANVGYLTEKAVNPDMRRYVMKEEAPRHYIDLDCYGDSAAFRLPRYWHAAVEALTEDTLTTYGVVPWHVYKVFVQLRRAFTSADCAKVLRYSADLGHYVADANVPLHTTSNYNGQKTGQVGVHGLWESRLPELFAQDYNLFTGSAAYLDNPQISVWDYVIGANAALDSVLSIERRLTKRCPESDKYGYEERNGVVVRVYSFDFSRKYHKMLSGMVERQMRRSVKLLGDLWYTAWVDGGQPHIALWGGCEGMEKELLKRGVDGMFRNHEGFIENN